MISNEQELAAAVARVSRDLDDIQHYLGPKKHPHARIKFPRGYLRRAVVFRKEYWYLTDQTLTRNLAYAHILSGVFSWLIYRTDLGIIAGQMVIKEWVCLMAAICESLTKSVAVNEGVCGARQPFKQRCDALRDSGYISAETCKELHDLWDIRQNEHIFLVHEWELGKYSLDECEFAVKTLNKTKSEIGSFFAKRYSPGRG